MLVAACAGDRGGAPVDAGVDDLGGSLLVASGVAGQDSLHYWSAGQETTLFADATAQPFCGGRIFCDLPPSPTLARLLYYTFVDESHAVFVESDHQALAHTQIYVADVRTGEKTALGDDVAWPQGSWDNEYSYGRPGWIYSFARLGASVFFSLETRNGVELLSWSGPGSTLTSIATIPIEAGERVIGTRLSVSPHGLVHYLEAVPANPGAPREVCAVRRLDGTLVYGPADLPAGRMCSSVALQGARVLLRHVDQNDYSQASLMSLDLVTDERLDIALPANTGLGHHYLSADGRRVVVQRDEQDPRVRCVYDLLSGMELGCVPGESAIFSPTDSDVLIVHDAAAYQLTMYRFPDLTPTVLIDGSAGQIGFVSWVEPAGLQFSPDGRWLVVATGMPFSDLSDNVGLSLVSMVDHQVYEVEPPAFSEQYYRQARFSPDSRHLLYLKEDVDNLQLDVVAVDLDTRQPRRILDTPGRPERGFVVGPAFAP